MNVYGGNTFINGHQVRAIVACKRSELPDIIGGKAAKAYARDYWSMTGNETEIKIALSRPGVLFYRDLDARGVDEKNYHAVDRKTP